MPESQLRRFTSGLPDCLRAEWQQYNTARRIARGARQKRFCHPYWMLLPHWLELRYARKQRPGLSRANVGKIQWAQYALFMTVRIEDDLFDGQTASASLAFVAREFLEESEKQFRTVFADNRQFWRLFRNSLRTTSCGILCADAMMRNRRTPADRLLRTYTRVAEIFKVGAGGVCLLADRWDDFHSISAFADEMAMAGQIVDDLQDLAEDLRRGRVNYVARVALDGLSIPIKPDRLENVVSERFFRSRAAVNVLETALQHIARAEKQIRPLNLPGVMEFTRREQDVLHKLANRLHQDDVRMVFEPLLKQSRRMRTPKSQN